MHIIVTIGEKMNMRVGRMMATRNSCRGVPLFFIRDWYKSFPVSLRSFAAFLSRSTGAYVSRKTRKVAKRAAPD